MENDGYASYWDFYDNGPGSCAFNRQMQISEQKAMAEALVERFGQLKELVEFREMKKRLEELKDLPPEVMKILNEYSKEET